MRRPCICRANRAQLVGDWRGLYFHKNIAGAVSAITALVFFFSGWKRKRVSDFAIGAAAIAFTVMTRSKSSLMLLPVALAAGAIYRVAWKTALDRWIVGTLAGLFVLGLAAFLAADRDVLARLAADPEGFTGRTEIWHAEFAFIRDHALFGSGFGSFADTGALSPLHAYMGSNWVGAIANGHNGYLELGVTIGRRDWVLR